MMIKDESVIDHITKRAENLYIHNQYRELSNIVDEAIAKEKCYTDLVTNPKHMYKVRSQVVDNLLDYQHKILKAFKKAHPDFDHRSPNSNMYNGGYRA